MSALPPNRSVTGDNESWSDRPLKVRRLALPLHVPAHTVRDFLVRIQTSTPVVFPAAVQPDDGPVAWVDAGVVDQWVILGGLLAGCIALILDRIKKA